MKWLLFHAALASTVLATDRVVINEIHFDPVEKGPLEFVELFNPSPKPVDLTGWRLDKFQFPDGTVVEGNGFVVLAQNPEAFAKEFGRKALGPLPGKLSNEGEKLTLTNADGRIVEQFKYGVGFPWPTASAGAGSSLERIHPDLDPAQPGAWRASGYAADQFGRVFIPAGNLWRWRKGETEASEPRDAWRQSAFVEDATWQSGRAGFGYEDGDDGTTLNDMRGRYGCVFLRGKFTVHGLVPDALQLRVRVDDGCIIWLNGHEVARLHVPNGEPSISTAAINHEAGEWEDVMIGNAKQWIAPGDNVLAVQAFNSTPDSSDFSIDVVLQTPGGTQATKRPTPGAPNSVISETPLPSCRVVRHEPAKPKPGQAVVVSAEFNPGQPPQIVTLQVQAVEPGAYVRKSDPEYAQRWEDLPMRDDGREGDSIAGDRIWTVTLPPERQVNRRLIRYRIIAADAAGSRLQLPYLDDEVPNFAYYIWQGPPSWAGSMRPGQTPAITFSGEFQQTLPTFTLLANADDVARSQWDGGYNHKKLPGTLIYDGEVFDHIEFKNRGSASVYVAGKNKWGFHFPNGHDLPMRDPWGRPYKAKWNSFALNACASPWVQPNRGMAGLDEAVSFRCYQLAGIPASDTIPIHFRVVTGKNEQGSSQYEGDLWGLYLIVEDVDRAFLDNHKWPDGIIASHEKGIKRVPSDSTVDPQIPWGQFSAGPKGNVEQWWRDRMDLQSYYSFHAINRLVGNVDLRPGANHHFYQHPDRGWMPIPWDLDMQFIPRQHQPGFIDQIRCLDVPALRLEFQSRAREILDLLGSDPSPDGGQIGQVIAEYARRIEPQSKPDHSWAMLDACLWNLHPRSGVKGTFFQLDAGQQMGGGSFTRKLSTPDLAGFCRYALEYATDARPQKNYAPNDGQWLGYGWGYLAHEAKDANIPTRPVVRYTGAEGFLAGSLTFAISPFADPQGAQTFAATQWRLAEISKTDDEPWTYEITPIWLGPEVVAQVAESHLPGEEIRAGTTYRVRARYKDNSGRWSHWSEPVQWTAR
jgi:hypothetical protein